MNIGEIPQRNTEELSKGWPNLYENFRYMNYVRTNSELGVIKKHILKQGHGGYFAVPFIMD